MRKKILGCLMIVGAVSVAPAFSQAQGYGDPSAAAAIEIRMQQMEKEIRKLTGQIEEQNYKIRQLEEELQRVTGDLSVRVGEMEGGGNSGTMSPYDLAPDTGAAQSMTRSDQRPTSSFQYQPPTGRAIGTIAELPESGGAVDSAAAAYEKAFALLKASDFDMAEVEFMRFISDYPDHVLIPNAKYWYGETFYVRGNYEKAARVFAEGYQQYPKGAKAADNLLKLGMSLAGVGKKDDACVALGQLEKEYAGSAGPVLRRGKQEMTRLGCK